MATVNSTLYELIILLDDSDPPVGVTGLIDTDFEVLEAYLLSDPSTTASVTLTEIGDGEYRFSFTPFEVGRWVAHYRYQGALDSPREGFAENDVVGAAATVTTSVSSGGIATTLAQLRSDIAADLGDYLPLTATADGTDVTLKDAQTVKLAANAYAGRQAYFKTGANAGQWRLVTGSDPSSHTITFDPALPSATANGDIVELFNERGRGFSKAEYDAAINRAIRFARGHALVDLMQTQTDPFDRESPEISISSEFLYISSVEYEDADGFWQELRRASSPTDSGWFLLPGRILRVQGGDAYDADSYSIRLIGQGVTAELSADDDTTVIDAEWIVMQASSYLDRAGIDRSKNRDRERTMQYRQNIAASLLPLIVTLPRVNAVRVT